MATKIKTTATFTFTFISDDEANAIHKLHSWISKQVGEDTHLVKDSDTGEYTYLNTNASIGSTFKFKTSAEFIEKFSKAKGCYAPVHVMVNNTNIVCVTTSTETIEVEEDN